MGVGKDRALSTDCSCCHLGPRSLGSMTVHPWTPEDPRGWGEQAVIDRAAHNLVISTWASVPLPLTASTKA